jgi:peptidoglycan/LPS O-acetylase OafA/YrhL
VTAPERHLQFRPDIEGLRAVAILLVVLYHAGWHRIDGGFLGVDVFFVLSGFLISGILVAEIDATGTVSLTQFWARRARRLLPAAAFILLVVLVMNAVLLSPFEQITFADTARSFAVYASNILFAVRSTDYFGGAAIRDPLLHTWSLSVEEQFYLFFAPSLLALAWWARTRGSDAFRRVLTVAAIAASIVSLAGVLLLVPRYPVIAFYSLPARAWEFGLGTLALVSVRRARTLGRPAAELLGAAGLAAVLISAVIVKEGVTPPLGLITLLPTLGTVALIVSGAGVTQPFVARLLSLAPLRLIGRLSYSWYLWHWPVLVYLREVRPEPSTRLSLAVALASLIPAAATYAWIESPIRFSKGLRQHSRQVVVAAVLLAAVTLAAGSGASAYAEWRLGTPRYATITQSRVSARTYADGCQVPLLSVSSPPCKYGPGTNDTTLVLLGDSHAAQWFPAVDSVASMRGWTLVNLTKTGCPTVTLGVTNSNLGRRYTECDSWRASAIRRVVEMRPTIVLIANAHTYNVIVGATDPLTDTSDVAVREWHDGLLRTLGALRPSGASLVVLEDTPRPFFDVPRCLVKFIDDPARCDLSAERALNPRQSEAERAAVAAVPGASYISLNDALCDAKKCPAQRDGVVRFRDNSHLSVRFAASLAPRLSETLTRAIAAPRIGEAAPRSASVLEVRERASRR